VLFKNVVPCFASWNLSEKNIPTTTGKLLNSLTTGKQKETQEGEKTKKERKQKYGRRKDKKETN
jgi:zona occludens toxin (predicted ATPase)